MYNRAVTIELLKYALNNQQTPKQSDTVKPTAKPKMTSASLLLKRFNLSRDPHLSENSIARGHET